MNDPASSAGALVSVDLAISRLMRLRVALEELVAEQKKAPESHEETQGHLLQEDERH